eukprot:COSAG04_NODE_7446_length_1127_cov_1.311284_1_plen_32_part_10
MKLAVTLKEYLQKPLTGCLPTATGVQAALQLS